MGYIQQFGTTQSIDYKECPRETYEDIQIGSGKKSKSLL